MNLRGRKIVLHDMCLRDGMHPKRHQISVQQMVAIAAGLDAAGYMLPEDVTARIGALRSAGEERQGLQPAPR